MNGSARWAYALIALGMAAGCASATRQDVVASREVGAFVVRLGQDTVSLEQFSRSATEFRGQQLLRVPRTVLREYEADLGADGTIREFRYVVRPVGEETASSRATVRFGPDTTVVTITEQGSSRELRVPAARETLPFLGYNLALYELPFVQMRRSGADTLVLDHLPIGAEQPFPLRIVREGDDSLIVENFAGVSRARVDADGRLLVWDGRGSGLAITADRAVTLDLDQLAAAYAARDAAGAGLGVLSPRDTLEATVQSAQVTVEYSRPARRGRAIFGNVVAWNAVWRTGADAATVLRTDRDLVIGDAIVPAGSYSLWTVPSETGWTLILNRQTGQWGTQHDPAQDLARVPMQMRAVTDPVEQFTIRLEDGPESGTLILEWDDQSASVPIRSAGAPDA